MDSNSAVVKLALDQEENQPQISSFRASKSSLAGTRKVFTAGLKKKESCSERTSRPKRLEDILSLALNLYENTAVLAQVMHFDEGTVVSNQVTNRSTIGDAALWLLNSRMKLVGTAAFCNWKLTIQEKGEAEKVLFPEEGRVFKILRSDLTPL